MALARALAFVLPLAGCGQPIEIPMSKDETQDIAGPESDAAIPAEDSLPEGDEACVSLTFGKCPAEAQTYGSCAGFCPGSQCNVSVASRFDAECDQFAGATLDLRCEGDQWVTHFHQDLWGYCPDAGVVDARETLDVPATDDETAPSPDEADG